MLPVLVLTKTYSTPLGVIRSLGSVGCHVEMLYVVSKAGKSRIAASSKYLSRTTEVVGRDESVIVNTIKELYGSAPQKWILFPTDDFTASLIDRHQSDLGPSFIVPHIVDGEPGDVTRLMSKDVQCALAKEAGLPVPRSWTILLAEGEMGIPSDMVYPCFVKPLVSFQGKKSELIPCKSDIELREALVAMRDWIPDRMVMVQEFVSISQEYSMSGLCIDDTVILPAVTRKLRVAQFQKGVTLSGEMVGLEVLEPLTDDLLRFLSSLHFVGMFDLEILRSGDQLFFGEVNLRPGGPNYFYQRCGANLPFACVEALSGDAISAPVEVELGKTFLYEKVAWDDYRYGFLSHKELRDLYNSVDYLLLDDPGDPKPGKEFRRFIKPRALYSRIKRVLRKQ